MSRLLIIVEETSFYLSLTTFKETGEKGLKISGMGNFSSSSLKRGQGLISPSHWGRAVAPATATACTGLGGGSNFPIVHRTAIAPRLLRKIGMLRRLIFSFFFLPEFYCLGWE